MVEIFGKCSRLLNKIALNMEDGFFSLLCAKESDKLLSEFVFFLKGEERTGYIAQSGVLRQPVVAKPGNFVQREHHVAQTGILQHQDIVKSDDIVQHEYRVAQYHLQLTSQIKNILNLLDILKHLGLAKLPTSLLLEKNLLLLKLSVLNACQQIARPLTETEKPIALKIRKTNLRRLPKLDPPKLGRTHQEVSEFIKGKERTQNLEVFNRFSHIGRRTLKRKLSELIKAGTIKRLTDGKKVFYTPGDTNSHS